MSIKNETQVNLAALADFQRVAASGSLGRASRDSGRSKATLSRHVRQLEESLGVRLVERGRHALRLTTEGRVLYERTHGLLRDIEDVGQHLASGGREPHGLLRISAPVQFAHALGGRLAAEFIAQHPQVRVDLSGSDRHVDLIEDGFDIAIRVNPEPDSELVGRCFARDAMVLVAPPSWPLPAAGTAATPTVVPAVQMAHLPELDRWEVECADGIRYLAPEFRLRLSALTMVHDAVRAGAGVALLPHSLTRADVASGRLAAWGHWRGAEKPAEFWVLHSSRRLVSPKVSAFIDYLVDSFPDRTI